MLGQGWRGRARPLGGEGTSHPRQAESVCQRCRERAWLLSTLAWWERFISVRVHRDTLWK